MDFKDVEKKEEESVLEKKEIVEKDFWRQKYHIQGPYVLSMESFRNDS